MRIFLALLVITLGWIMQGCTNEADRNAIRQMEQAAPLMQSDPEAAHALLTDSVTHPELFDWYAVALCAPNGADIPIYETTRHNR